MRSRECLADVMRTVNPPVVGVTLARKFNRAANVITKGEQDNKLLWHMIGYAEKHKSPHIRELATEANSYMVLDGLEF